MKAGSIRQLRVRSCGVCVDDAASGELADIDRGGCNGPCVEDPTVSVPRCRRRWKSSCCRAACSSSVDSAATSWRCCDSRLRPMSVVQEVGTRTIRMTAGEQRNRLAYSCTALGHRLESAFADSQVGDGRLGICSVSIEFFSFKWPLFLRYFAHVRSLQPPRS